MSERSSLKRRLTMQLWWVQAAIQLMVIGALLASGQLVSFSSPENTVEILQEAVVRDSNDRLGLDPTLRLARLRAENPELWFTVRDRHGRTLTEGRIPKEFSRVGDTLDQVGQARLGWNIGDPPRPAARIRWVDSRAGNVQIMTSADSPVTWRNFGLSILLLLRDLVVPILGITGLATLLATHFVVRRTLAGLHTAAAQAGRVDVDQRGVRLPMTDVPSEIATLVAAVNDALERLDAGYARQERFLADAAHELRTPIAILNTRIENLPEGQEKVRLLIDVSRLAVLTRQLLDMQRMKGRNDSFAAVDLVDLAHQVIADMAPLCIACGCDISLEAQIDRLLIQGDQGALERALRNVVQNAIDHGKGRVQVRISDAGTIDVIDDGQGIPAEHRELIFKPFYRVHAAGRGAGLGLSLVREIMEMHGGDIAVGDDPEGRTCIRMRFVRGRAG